MITNVIITPKKAGWHESESAELHAKHDQPASNEFVSYDTINEREMREAAKLVIVQREYMHAFTS